MLSILPLTETITQLQRLISELDSWYCKRFIENSSILIPILEKITSDEEQKIQESRTLLLALYHETFTNQALAGKFNQQGQEVRQIIYSMMLALTVLKPLNDTDPITMDVISDDTRVVLSSGHQFDITAFVNYHNERDYRGHALGETDKEKWLINPLTNQKLTVDDELQVLRVAAAQNLQIKNLKTHALSLRQGILSKEDRGSILSILTPDNRYAIITSTEFELYGHQVEKSDSVLYVASENPEEFFSLLDLLLPEDQFSAIWNVSVDEKNRPVLRLIENSERLKTILSAYLNAESRYGLSDDEFGYSIIHYASRSFSSLFAALESYPESERFKMINTPNHAGCKPLENIEFTNFDEVAKFLLLLPRPNRLFLLENIKIGSDNKLYSKNDPTNRFYQQSRKFLYDVLLEKMFAREVSLPPELMMDLVCIPEVDARRRCQGSFKSSASCSSK